MGLSLHCVPRLDLGGQLCWSLCGERGLRVVGRGLVRRGRRRRGVLHHLLVDELLPLLHRVLALVHRVVVRRRRRRVNLSLVVPDVDVGVQQRLVHGDATLGVNDQHAREQVPRLRRLEPVVLVAVAGEEYVGEEPLEAVAGVPRPVLHVVAHRRLQPRHERRRRSAQLLNDLVPLVDVVGAGEEHAAADHLAHDAAHRPDVHVLRVPHAQDHLWRAVVSGDDVGRHHEGRAGGARQTEVQDLQRAVALHYYVGRL